MRRENLTFQNKSTLVCFKRFKLIKHLLSSAKLDFFIIFDGATDSLAYDQKIKRKKTELSKQ